MAVFWYTKQEPWWPHWSCHSRQALSITQPKAMGPGMLPAREEAHEEAHQGLPCGCPVKAEGGEEAEQARPGTQGPRQATPAALPVGAKGLKRRLPWVLALGWESGLGGKETLWASQ